MDIAVVFSALTYMIKTPGSKSSSLISSCFTITVSKGDPPKEFCQSISCGKVFSSG